MATTRNQRAINRPLRCAHCGEVIGVYERLVDVISGTVARETSRAAEPEIATARGTTCYHVVCYEARAVP